MKRLFWLALGVTVGALVMRKLSRMAEKLTPRGMAGGFADALADLADALRDFGADVREAMKEREAQIREVVAVDGQLGHVSARWRDETALTVVMAARGYPEHPEKGSVIKGLDQAAAEGVKIFHAGTAVNADALVANGGRVLNVGATGQTVAEAQKKAYAAVDRIVWPGGFCRRDIGWRAVQRERAGRQPEG